MFFYPYIYFFMFYHLVAKFASGSRKSRCQNDRCRVQANRGVSRRFAACVAGLIPDSTNPVQPPEPSSDDQQVCHNTMGLNVEIDAFFIINNICKCREQTLDNCLVGKLSNQF